MAKNNLIARAQTLTGQRSYGTEGVYEIGSIMPSEHVYLKYEGTLTLERFRMVSNNLASAAMGIAALGEDILQKDVLDVNVLDNVTKNLVVTYRGCSAQSYEESFRVSSITTESITFLYLTSSNASNS